MNQKTKTQKEIMPFSPKKETLTRRVGRKLEGVSHSLGSRKDSHTVASVGQQVGDGGRAISSLLGDGQIALGHLNTSAASQKQRREHE